MDRFCCISPLHSFMPGQKIQNGLSSLLKKPAGVRYSVFFLCVFFPLILHKSLDLFVYNLIIYHLNGAMDLHSKCFATELFCMARGLPRPPGHAHTESPELLVSFSFFHKLKNCRGKWLIKPTLKRSAKPQCQNLFSPARHTAVVHWCLGRCCTPEPHFTWVTRPTAFRRTMKQVTIITSLTCRLSSLLFQFN